MGDGELFTPNIPEDIVIQEIFRKLLVHSVGLIFLNNHKNHAGDTIQDV